MELTVGAMQVGLDAIARSLPSDRLLPAVLATCKAMKDTMRCPRFTEGRCKATRLEMVRQVFFHLTILIADNRWIARIAATDVAFRGLTLAQTANAYEEFQFTRALPGYNDPDGAVRHMIDPEDFYRVHLELAYERNNFDGQETWSSP